MKNFKTYNVFHNNEQNKIEIQEVNRLSIIGKKINEINSKYLNRNFN